MLEYIFKAVLITSLIGAVLTLFLAVIKPITRRFFSSRWNYYVWLVVLFVMIIPFRFTNPEVNQNVEPVVIYSPIQEMISDNAVSNVSENEVAQKSLLGSMTEFMDSNADIFAFIWLLGAAFMLLSKLAGYWIYLLKLHKSSDVILFPELSRFTDKKIITRVSDKISSPLMIGIFKPTLLLPKTAMTEEQLNNVLSHEMTHFKRKDILYKWFVCLVKCIHWFNPAIYFASRQISIDCEISCDTEVVKDMSEEQQTRYIDTIITLLATGNKRPATITTGMVSDKKTLQRRFTMIKNKMKISKKAMVISIVLVLAVAGTAVFASGVLNGKLVDEPEDEIIQSMLNDPKLEKIETDTGKIVYDKENGDVVAAVSEPKLVPDKQPEKNPKPKEAYNMIVNETENTSVLSESNNANNVSDNPVEGEISMPFGKRVHPITKEVSEHNGVDIKAPEGTDVVSSITGTVTDVGFDSEKGNYVVVENDNVKTLYAQLATTTVNKGDQVNAKQSIGTVGKTGKATGAHLHYEVMVDGEYKDPATYIK